MYSKVKLAVVSVGVSLTLAGCGNSADGDEMVSSSELQMLSSSSQNSLTQDLIGALPAGDITSYGAITVGDEAGMASDLVAAFFKLDSGVSAQSLMTAFSGNQTLCTVDDDDIVDFEEISVGFIPSFNGINKQAISAGGAIVLGSDAGTYATIQSHSAGSFLFYTLPDSQVLPSQPVPEGLRVDIAGDEFPSFSSALLPEVDKLDDVDLGGNTGIASTSKITWNASSDSGSMVRIFASTAGGFFDEDGMTVTCLTPDTGSFEFPEATQARLGAGFVGGPPIVSRIAVSTVTNGNSALFLIRETFAE